MDKNDIIEYVMNTPHNTNRAVLTSMLNQLAKGGSDDSWAVLTEETVITSVTEGDTYASGRITYVELITEDTIKITFNDMEYTCQNDSDGIMNRFGAPWSDELNGYDFSVYPFAISSIGINGGVMNTLYTETAGAYTIKIEAPQSGGSSDFSTATVTNAGETLFGGQVALISEDNQSESHAVFLPNTTKEVILYKGRARWDFFDGPPTSIATTGAIAYDAENGCYIITGDCTIAIS